MAIRKRFGLPALAALLVSALVSGCGNSSSSSTVPLTTTVFYSHTVAFRNSTSQTLFATGYNGFGQLGTGDLKNRSVATPVSGLGPVKKSAMGADHTLAIFDNATTVLAWGSNNHGQIGDAVSNSGSSAFSSSPVKVHLKLRDPSDVVTDIAAGGFHSLAVVNGEVRSWGYNGFGQLGDGTLADKNVVTTVVDASASHITGITSVAAGGEHSLALTNNGTVYAWGNNDKGQLAVLVTVPTYRPNADLVQVVNVTLTNVVQIAAGANFSVALKDDGTVLIWGSNGGGQLGVDPTGTSADALFSATPTPIAIPPAVLNGATVTKVSAGLDHVLALLSDGSVVAWGLNNNAQLGLGTLPANDPLVKGFSITPAKVVGIGGTGFLSGATDIIAFGNQSLALVNGHWYGWGDNGFGQLGNPVSTNAIGYIKVPTPVQF
jgi:alpha-tubulin suppressor-like RCC1 family protein